MPTLSPATHALFSAIAAHDREGVAEALEDGADPAALGQCEGLQGGLPALHLACLLAVPADVTIVDQLLHARAPTAPAGHQAAFPGDALDVLLHRLPPPNVVPFLRCFAAHGIPATPAHFLILLLQKAPAEAKVAALDTLWDILSPAHRTSAAIENLLARWLVISLKREHSLRPDPLLVSWLLEHGSRLEAYATPTTPTAHDVLERYAPDHLRTWQHRQAQQEAFRISDLGARIAPWLDQALDQGRRAGA